MNTQVKIISVMWFVLLVNYFDRVAISFAGPAIMKSLAMGPATFGLVLSSFSVGYLIAQLPGGILADRIGARPLLVVAPILWALFTGLTGLVSLAAGFVVVRFSLGISEGLFNTSYYKAMAENFEPRNRAQALSVCSTAVTLAPAFAGPVVGFLVGAFGWRTMFALLIIPAVLAALGTYAFIPARGALAPIHDAPSLAGEGGLRDVLRQPSLWLLSLFFFAFNIPYWGYLGWMPTYLATAHHIDLKSIGALGGIPYAFAFAGMVIGGRLASTVLDQYRPQFVAACSLSAGLALYLAYQADTLATSLAGLCGAAFFLFAVHGPLGSIALELAPEKARATYVGTYNTVGQLGAVVAPVAIGFLVKASGTFAGGFAFMVAGLCVAAGCILALSPMITARARRTPVAA